MFDVIPFKWREQLEDVGIALNSDPAKETLNGPKQHLQSSGVTRAL
jgi:hypothetical protein